MLILSGCTKLETHPKGKKKNLISLQHLEITIKQRVLPEDEIANLSSLQTLRIEFCSNLESLFGMLKLPTLKVLCVANCKALKSLPLDIEHFLALETLLVDNCDMLQLSEEHLSCKFLLCKEMVQWTREEKRTFLRQRVEARLATLLMETKKYSQALTLLNGLIKEVRRLDDKLLPVDIDLLESKLHFSLRNLPKLQIAQLTEFPTNL